MSAKILDFIPQDSALHYKIVPIGVKDGVLEVGALDPNDLEARDALTFISSKIGMPYKLFLISDEDFQTAMGKYQGLTGEVTEALSELESEIAAKSAEMPEANKKDTQSLTAKLSRTLRS